MGHVCDRVEEALPSNKKKKAEEEALRIDQIKREAAESAVQKFMHCQDREQNAKLQFRIGNLDAKLDAMFVCKEE
jgi:BMFP domain-containing protein YqiC